MQKQLDFNAAAAARDEAIAACAAKAGDPWLDDAYDFLIEFAMDAVTFISEDVVTYAMYRGLPPPSDYRAWGAVVRRAARAGMIEKTGDFKLARTSHLSPKPVWRYVGKNLS